MCIANLDHLQPPPQAFSTLKGGPENGPKDEASVVIVISMYCNFFICLSIHLSLVGRSVDLT